MVLDFNVFTSLKDKIGTLLIFFYLKKSTFVGLSNLVRSGPEYELWIVIKYNYYLSYFNFMEILLKLINLVLKNLLFVSLFFLVV